MIELLVVMAVIAILAALLLPVLARAKLRALEANCMSNQRQIAIAIAAYATDNADAILPYPTFSGDPLLWGRRSLGGFVSLPALPSPFGLPRTTEDGFKAFVRQQSAEYALEFTRGILRTGNPLFPYAANTGVYHCPADKRFQREPAQANGWTYLSYAKTENMAGDPHAGYWGILNPYRKSAEIRSPALTFQFTEAAGETGWGNGPWYVSWIGIYDPPQRFRFIVPPGIHHGIRTVFTYADGHVAAHKWRQPKLVRWGSTVGRGDWFSEGGTIPSAGPDYSFVGQNYQFPKWQLPSEY